MKIIRNRHIRENRWRVVPEGTLDGLSLSELPDAVIVTLPDWQQYGHELAKHRAVGVRLSPGDEVGAIAADLELIELVALEFGSFAEGRPYSAARVLRERFGYAGEIRAVGDVSKDRLAFMERCGINAFELREDCDPHEALRAFEEISHVYQRAADARAVIGSHRA